MTAPDAARPVSFVILAKETTSAKTRLSPDRGWASELALQLATRTIEVAVTSRHAASVVVVTSDPSITRSAGIIGADVVAEGRPIGINQAAVLGRREALAAHPTAAVAILVADLPLLSADDLDTMVAEFAEAGAPMFVADHLTEGTTCVIHPADARPGIAFGRGSARMHGLLGYAQARRPLRGLRMDLDTPDDLARVRRRPRARVSV